LIKLLTISNKDDKNLFVYTTKLLLPEKRRAIGTPTPVQISSSSNINAVIFIRVDIDEAVVALLYETILTIYNTKRNKSYGATGAEIIDSRLIFVCVGVAMFAEF